MSCTICETYFASGEYIRRIDHDASGHTAAVIEAMSLKLKELGPAECQRQDDIMGCR